ncbi:hypothetical protein P20652_0917 [Pseudoalteromonas sp. BSi20652]|nr:hypothetical protein P20652_0917 [Pseudoalteromonas sp. BSi20652]
MGLGLESELKFIAVGGQLFKKGVYCWVFTNKLTTFNGIPQYNIEIEPIMPTDFNFIGMRLYFTYLGEFN